MSDYHQEGEVAPLLEPVGSAASTSQKQVVNDPMCMSQQYSTIQASTLNTCVIVDTKVADITFCTNINGDVESCQGYSFTTNGQLLNLESKEGFKFSNQQEYEELGEWIGETIYKKMTQEPYNLQKLYLKEGGLDDVQEQSLSFVFASPELKQAKHLVVLIHGTGVVRAGQWSRKLIINESLEVGSQLPYIRECQMRGWSVLLMNTNDNFYFYIPPVSSNQVQSSTPTDPKPETVEEVVASKVSEELSHMPSELAVEPSEVSAAEEGKTLADHQSQKMTVNVEDNKGNDKESKARKTSSPSNSAAKKRKRKLNSGSAEEHGLYVWENLVQPLSYYNHELKIAIVAHSYGGRVTMEILSHLANSILHIDDNHQDTTSALDCLTSIKCICLTDAIFDEPILSWLKPTAPKTRNWITSSLPVDTKLPRTGNITFSAGTDEHERTSAAAKDSVFKFIEECFEDED